MKKYWYKFNIYECPVCGRGDSYKERVYTKPSLKAKYTFHSDYCGCLG